MTEEEIQKKIDDAVAGLKAKNAELLADIKKIKDEKKSIAEALSETESEKKRIEEETALKSGDIEKIKEQLNKKHQNELQKLTEQLANSQNSLNSVMIDGGISDALSKANIAPAFVDAVKALFKTNYKPEVLNENGKVQAVIDGKSIQDFVTEWTQSDNGKHYVLARDNSGGGGEGAKGNTTGKVLQRTVFESLSPADKTNHLKSGGKLVD